MPQTRISDDVWALAEEVSDRMGLNSPRLAIEAIVRVYASHYTAGIQIPKPSQPVQLKPVKPEPLQSVSTESDAAAAIANLMQSF